MIEAPPRKICLAVCARQDSEELRSLIRALTAQKVPPGWQVATSVCVINFDREMVPDSSKLLASLGGDGFEVLFEPREGIPFARNKALDFAMEQRATWLAFIDDDCFPAENWLFELCSLVDATSCSAAAGAWSIVPEGRPSPWIPAYVWGPKYYKVGLRRAENFGVLDTAYTRSVLFRIDDEVAQRLGSLKFSTSHATRGGSDVLFFEKYSRSGFEIRFAGLSVVEESYRGARLRFAWHLKQRIRNAQLVFERSLGNSEFLTTRAITFFGRIVRSFATVILWWHRYPGIRNWRQRLGHFCLSWAPAVGLVMEILGFRYHAYADTWKWLR